MNVDIENAHLRDLITRAQRGEPTVITRDGAPAAAVVPFDEFEALEDALDERLAIQADRTIASDPGGPAVSLAEMVAEVHGSSGPGAS